MSKQKQYHKKPGIKDVVKVTSALIQELQIAQERINELYGAIDMYIEFKGDGDAFKAFLDTKLKESKSDKENNEQTDGQNSKSDNKNEGVRAEGIRP